MQAWLDQYFLNISKQGEDGLFRLSIDRTFNLKGIGLVVTGTILDGVINTGDAVRLLPEDKIVKVRQIHAQDQPVNKAGRGLRCALNISGDINKSSIRKGDWLTGLEAGDVTRCFTALADFSVSSVRIRHMMPVKLYLGARHVDAKLSLCQGGELLKKFQGHQLVQIITEQPVSCLRGDRYLLRDSSESFLLGGGKILDPWAPRTRNVSDDKSQYLSTFVNDDFITAIRQLLIETNNDVDYELFRQAWNLSAVQALEKIGSSDLKQKLKFAEVGQRSYVLSENYWQSMLKKVFDSVNEWHKQHPDQQGIGQEILTENLDEKINHLLPALLEELQSKGLGNKKLIQVGGLVKCSDFQTGFSEKAQAQWQKIEKILNNQGLDILLLSELEKKSGVQGRELNYLISSGIKSGRLFRVSQKRVGLPATLKKIADEIIVMAREKPSFTVIEFRDHLGTGRNYVIELLDFMDTVGFTRRVGNERIIIDEKVPKQVFN